VPREARRTLGSVAPVSGRHLRRARTWWLRRALAPLVVLAVGAAAGAGATVALDAVDEEVRAGEASASLEPTPGPITIALAGEVAPGAALTARLGGASDDLLGPYGPVLASADLAVVDLSATVVAEPPPDTPAVPTTVLDELEAVGIDVASLGNDRSLDLGVGALGATLDVVGGRRTTVVGIGADEDAAYAPVVREVGGRTVAVLGATQVLDASRLASDTAGPGLPGVASAKRVDRLVAEVRSATEAADVVVVYVHWGEPGQTCPSAGQQELAAALVDAGADVVVGTGTGTVQGVGRLGDAVVAYGLGGLVADGATEAGALLVEVGTGGVAGWSWAPGQVVFGVAEPLPDDLREDVGAELDARRACAALTP